MLFCQKIPLPVGIILGDGYLAILINMFKGDPLEIAGFLNYDPIELQEICDLIKTSGQSTAEFKEECLRRINSAQTLRKIERPSNSLKMLNTCAYLLNSRIKTKVDCMKDVQDFRFMLLKTYGEKIECLNLILPREEVLYAVIPINSCMNKLVSEINNGTNGHVSDLLYGGLFKPDASGSQSFSGSVYSDCGLASAYFVEKQYDKAIKYQKKSIPLCGFDKNLLAETYRGLILGLAHKKRIKDTNCEIKKAYALLGKEIDDQVDIDTVLCAIAEAKMLIGEHGAKEVLKVVEKTIYRSKRFLPLKKIQYYKTKLFLAINYFQEFKRINIRSVEQIAKEGVTLAKLYGLDRHMHEIDRLFRMIVGIDKSIFGYEFDDYDRTELTIVQKFI